MQNNEHRFFGILCCWINVWYDYGCDAINSFRQNGFLRATLEFHWFETLGFCSFVWRTNLYFYQRSVFSIIMALLFCGGIFHVFLFQFFSLSVYFLWSKILPFIISYFDFPLKIVFIVVFFLLSAFFNVCTDGTEFQCNVIRRDSIFSKYYREFWIEGKNGLHQQMGTCKSMLWDINTLIGLLAIDLIDLW